MKYVIFTTLALLLGGCAVVPVGPRVGIVAPVPAVYVGTPGVVVGGPVFYPRYRYYRGY